ncbi:unnamed protein product [Wuchereria bancrofti]|uniref:Uncharacterized protein n=1 Tax=Wuchereria bancrofti TaxID=6293 RepID=A0A3P7GAW0_WUCBA|nr:unnamed protein product [Wuchereria bancrofti]
MKQKSGLQKSTFSWINKAKLVNNENCRNHIASVTTLSYRHYRDITIMLKNNVTIIKERARKRFTGRLKINEQTQIKLILTAIVSSSSSKNKQGVPGIPLITLHSFISNNKGRVTGLTGLDHIDEARKSRLERVPFVCLANFL